MLVTTGAIRHAKLQSNHHHHPAKSEVLWRSSARRQHQIPSDPVYVGNTSVLPVSVVRDLGVCLDADLSMIAHITATVRTCFVALQQIRNVCRSLTPDALLTLLHALVITKLDFCCSTLAGVSGALLQRLQSVLNAAGCSASVLGKEIATHNSSSPATALVKSSRENQILVVCSGPSLPP